jgi:hypothetical protein
LLEVVERTPTRDLVRTPAAVGRDRRLSEILLTAPVFAVYHLGVVFLEVRNGFDPITDLLLSVLSRSLLAYIGITLAISAALAVAIRVLGVTREFRPKRMALRLLEATGYALVMAIVARNAAAYSLSTAAAPNPLAAVVLSFGAGFYEEIAFRVVLFGAGAFLISRIFKGWRAIGLEIGWAVVAAGAFSAVHYLGPLSDSFKLGSFVFRLTCGLVLTVIYRLRGFAAAVWTHAIYDVAVMI